MTLTNEADHASVSLPFHFDLLDSHIVGLPCLRKSGKREDESEAIGVL